MEIETDGNVEQHSGSARVRSRRVACVRAMKRHPEVVCVFLGAACLLLANVSFSFHQKQITRPAQLPQKFFPSHSGVDDSPYGSLQTAIKLLQDEELIFVMYYAPWSADSMTARGEFIQAAKIMNSVVKFVAINCWWPEGECRQRMKFFAYPELFVYHTRVHDGYRYTGPKTADYFVKFVEGFLQPLTHLRSNNDVKNLVARQDNAVIGYFDFNSSPQPPGPAYNQFYLTALRITSIDMFQPVLFGVVSDGDVARKHGLQTINTMALIRPGNTTLNYPDTMNMTSKNMTNWILLNKQKSFASWLVPPGVKSITLSMAMEQGPSVLVLGPVSPLFDSTPVLNIVREAALRYSCNLERERVEDIVDRNLFREVKSLAAVEKLRHACQQRQWEKLKSVPSYNYKCCYCLMTGDKTRHQSVCEYCVHQQKENRLPDCYAGLGSKMMPNLNAVQGNSCSNSYQFYDTSLRRSLCCKEWCSRKLPPGYIDSMSTRKITDEYVLNGVSSKLKRQCMKLTLQKMKNSTVVDSLLSARTLDADTLTRFSGLQCRTNRSVQFLFLDSVHHSIFAERLGLSGQSKQASVILVDKKNEAHHILREEFSLLSLSNFVLNYTSNSLVRHLRTSEPVSPSSSAKVVDTTSIEEVTSSTFQAVVMDPYKDVVLLFYAPWCGFCSSFAQTYLSLNRYFMNAKNITFARIDGSSNDLPWEYTVESYPTILFFPKSRKSESVVFPDSVEKSLPNLVKFVLHHASLGLQLNTMATTCTNQCVETNTRRVQSKVAELSHQIGQLQRRSHRLWGLVRSPGKHSVAYIKMANEALRKVQQLRQFQLDKAELLRFMLSKGLKALDEKIVLNIMEKAKH